MMPRFSFVTGTDTGVGKTVLACLLTRTLRRAGVAVAALKPVCSGGRTDARALHAALEGTVGLDEINPWHFPVPLAPLLAARKAGRRVRMAAVLKHIRHVAARFETVLIEGAGGLLSPLGEDFDARDLIIALRARPIVACPNRLGAVNQALLVVTALPPARARDARVVLISPRRPDNTCRTNAALLAENLGPGRVHAFPWLDETALDGDAPLPRKLRRELQALLQ